MSAARGWAPAAVSRRTTVSWPRRYASRLFFSDALVIAGTLFGFGLVALPEFTRGLSWSGGPRIPYWVALVLVGLIWLVMLELVDTRDEHHVSQGVLEYQRIVRASLALFAVVVATSFFLRIEFSRSLLLVGVPITMVLLVVSRWVWRQWLRAQQREGRYVHHVVVLGEEAKVAHIVRTIRRTPGTGYVIMGAVTKHGKTRDGQHDIPVLGKYGDAEKVLDELGADTLIFAGSDDYEPEALQRLGRAMADRDVNWVVAPALTDVAGPRIHSQPVAGLPLIHVSYPELEGARRVIKRTFDIVASTLLIVFFSPVMLGVAIAVRADSHGPIIYRQERVGRRGRTFGMIKFRSMIANADDQLSSLLDMQGTTSRPLFKVVDDPRITKVGRVIRRHSLDELPQLFNVFWGQMSLVGPRPQRAAEVELYDDVAQRRLFVKPGMSGLWQVSGRSSLGWDDALRLDLYYIENWSFTQDILILFRTVKAVVAPGKSAH
ncbi:sugar transferase [Microbacterium protaetiae]|uniref:Sugar transferase n=2 Tax=Microbacterium protaetiae TaxID=2509458 RepID=A0A4P6EUY3_9MICO|nr:sugar transferase [Microbacterium protaetiae]